MSDIIAHLPCVVPHRCTCPCVPLANVFRTHPLISAIVNFRVALNVGASAIMVWSLGVCCTSAAYMTFILEPYWYLKPDRRTRDHVTVYLVVDGTTGEVVYETCTAPVLYMGGGARKEDNMYLCRDQHAPSCWNPSLVEYERERREILARRKLGLDD